ncbi:response regulator transcription factor [Mucilaginibacter auburnensis]|uniref:Response regulator receiver domain-containing protein n=1 Tax=Mucilaginibacter auburnensis TaxID=1457233 RepID=A0A2H9VUT0_9SPHI|nr:response regulator [Mucilaginibacter auburnensis]PJJ84590.1 response regulator receiver domain-containing protein [Mucilaginibacter auburnensis]
MRRILVVDDDKDILEVIQYVLEDSGYTVETLTNGHTLFDKIRTYKPDLIILDIMLGNMDGRILCSQIKSNVETYTIPIIMISASHALADINSPKGRPDDFISKPFDIDSLVNSVERQIVA